jgi:hypothetical protein
MKVAVSQTRQRASAAEVDLLGEAARQRGARARLVANVKKPSVTDCHRRCAGCARLHGAERTVSKKEIAAHWKRRFLYSLCS